MTDNTPSQDNSAFAFKCAGCGNFANDQGETFCNCASAALYRSSDQRTLIKPAAIDEQIAELTKQRDETLASIRTANQIAFHSEARHD